MDGGHRLGAVHSHARWAAPGARYHWPRSGENVGTYRDGPRNPDAVMVSDVKPTVARPRLPHYLYQCSKRFTATTALVPPNAKALLMATRIGRARAQFGVTSRSHSGSSSSMLIVGGTIPWRIASMTAIISRAPLAPSACPCIDF